MAVIAIDMDGTIVNFTELSFKKVYDLYGIKMEPEDAKIPKTAELVWERMSEEQKAKYSDPREIYGEVCAKGFFLDVKPFPGAIEGVNKLAAAGHEIFFLTKVLNWDRSAAEKAVWLDAHFPDLKYTIIMVDSLKAKHLFDADIIIDDDVRVIDGCLKHGKTIPICIAQPWNEGRRDRYPIIANSFLEAVEEVEAIVAQINKWVEEK